MSNIICEIYIGKNGLEDDFTIYDDGKIVRVYDVDIFTMNIQEELTVDSLSESKKARLMEKCPENFKQEVGNLLYPK